MAIGRLSSYNLHQALLRDTTRSQSDLANLQGQISSGIKSSTFSGLGTSIEQFADLDSRLSRSQSFIDGSKILEGRLNVADNAMNAMIETATDIKNLIALRRNSSVGESLAFDQQLVGKWQSLTSQVNITLEGRYIFSGTATDTPPVSSTDFPQLQEDGVPDKGYYQGSSGDITVRIEDNVTITYNSRADDPAFQKIFAGLAMAKKFGQVAGDNEGLQTAYDMIAQGVDGLISMRAVVNANKVAVTENFDRLTSQKLYWKGLKEEISNTDIVAVSTEVAVNQGILQAAYQAFARISSLKLSDFLR